MGCFSKRNQLAVTAEMKPSVGYVIQVEVTKRISAQAGIVGAQGAAQGGANQLHFIVNAADRSSVLKYVLGSGKALP